MTIKLTLWAGMDVQKREYETDPESISDTLDCIRHAVADFHRGLGRPPSDMRLKVR